jgi:hypothetical protein
MHKLRKLVLAASVSAAALLAGCTSAQVNQSITDACTAIGAGATLAATISGGGLAQTLTQVIGLATTDCPVFATSVSGIISDVTGGGASASVAVAASSPTMKGRYGSDRVVFHFLVSPNGSVAVAPASAALLSRLR